jgi:hypothetical protein
MANGDQNQQWTDDQIRAGLAFAGGQGGNSANIPQSYVDAFQQYPSFLNALNYGSTPQIGGGPTTYNQPSNPNMVGGQSVGGLMNLIQAVGGGGQQNSGPPVPGSSPFGGAGGALYATDKLGRPTGKPVAYANASDAMGLLGASALGMPYVQNPMPSGTTNPKSGTGKVGGALMGTTTPDVVPGPWSNVSGVFGAAAPGSAFATPAPTAGGTPTPAIQPGGIAAGPQQVSAGTPWATAPPAPGVNPGAGMANAGMGGGFGMGPPGAPTRPMQAPSFAAHTSALADAGRALYAHFGGDPNSAGPADIADFHTKLTSALGPALKMQSGGFVPGRGDTDHVPALLQPGEYVLNRQQVQQLGNILPANIHTGAPGAPARMQTGGSAQSSDDEPPEARRKALSVPNPQRGADTQQQQPAQGSGGTGGQGSGAAPSSFSEAMQNLANLRNQRQAQSQGQPIGGTGYSPAAGGYVGISPGTGQSGYIYPTQAAATAGGTTGQGAIGMGPNTSQASGAIGGLASGLASAAQTYAASIKPWQIQPSSPMMYAAANQPPPPPVQLQQPSSPQGQQQKQQSNPYVAALMAANPTASYANMA